MQTEEQPGEACGRAGQGAQQAGGVPPHPGVHPAGQYSTVQCSTVQYSTVQFSTVQYSTVQFSQQTGQLETVSSVAARAEDAGRGGGEAVEAVVRSAEVTSILECPVCLDTMVQVGGLSTISTISTLSTIYRCESTSAVTGTTCASAAAATPPSPRAPSAGSPTGAVQYTALYSTGADCLYLFEVTLHC